MKISVVHIVLYYTLYMNSVNYYTVPNICLINYSGFVLIKLHMLLLWVQLRSFLWAPHFTIKLILI